MVSGRVEVRKVCSDVERRRRKVNFMRRKEGLKKKLFEFTKLCDIQAFMLCFEGGDDDVHHQNHRVVDVWPEKPEELFPVVDRYNKLKKNEREKNHATSTSMDISSSGFVVMEDDNNNNKKKKKEVEEENQCYMSMSDEVDRLGLEESRDLLRVLETKLEEVRKKAAELINLDHHHQHQVMNINQEDQERGQHGEKFDDKLVWMQKSNVHDNFLHNNHHVGFHHQHQVMNINQEDQERGRYGEKFDDQLVLMQKSNVHDDITLHDNNQVGFHHHHHQHQVMNINQEDQEGGHFDDQLVLTQKNNVHDVVLHDNHQAELPYDHIQYHQLKGLQVNTAPKAAEVFDSTCNYSQDLEYIFQAHDWEFLLDTLITHLASG